MDCRGRAADGPRTLLIACGALAKEVVEFIRLNGWHHLTVTCLPAIWHNTPDKIPEAVRAKIRAGKAEYDRVFVLYGDCGTGGLLDQVLEEEGVERIAGPHCYAFFQGVEDFIAEADADPACFYLTDYLVRHFDRLIIQGLGIDRHPELLPVYFGNYTTLVYLAQTEDPSLTDKAKAAAEKLGLTFRTHFTGYGELGDFIAQAAELKGGGWAEMAQLTVVYWRDIPAQVIVKAGRQTAKRQLSERFEQAIDRAAMRASLRDTDSYLAEWRRAAPETCGDDLEAEAADAAERLESDYPEERLKALVMNGGLESGQ